MNNEIKCPKCGEKFKIDEAGYAEIVRQVRNSEFQAELKKQEEALLQEKASAIKLAEANTKNALQQELADAREAFQQDLAARDREISELKSKANTMVADLKAKLDLATAETTRAKETADTARKLAVAEAVSKVEKERDALKVELASKESENKLIEASLKEKYEVQIRDRDETIDRLKELKAKLSTKMVGETLEQHCQTEFNRVRAMSFPRAEFAKDNDARTGSKGDFIYRERDDFGNEIISIMFEMKNENATTATKHKNEDFFKELDKDRREKNCEYAVLVSLLESDSELYNSGIVDVGYEYEKMFVIRPQFFLPLIGLLRGAAQNALKYKQELAVVRNQNVDITNFENDLNDWKLSWATNIKNAAKKHNDAVAQIDKAIADLQKVRDALTTSDKHLAAAENKMEKLTIKRLTRGNPTMQAKFEELEK